MRKTLGAVAAASILVLSACTVDGTATRTAPDYDTGPYPTTTGDTGLATPERLAGMRLGEFVPFRGDVDRRFLAKKAGTSPKSSLTNLGGIVEGAKTLPANREFRFGFTVVGGDTDQMTSGVLRYSSPDAARAAADAMTRSDHETALESARKYRSPLREIVRRPVAGLPAGASSSASPYPGRRDAISLLTLVPHGSDVLVARFLGASRGDAERFTRALVPTLVAASDAGRAVTVADEPASDLYRLAVGFAAGHDDTVYDGSVAGPRTQAQLSDDSAAEYARLKAAGVDAVANRATVLYRAGSDGQAATLRSQIEKQITDGGAARQASPRDIPSATCFDGDETTGETVCTLTVGRYVARADGDDLAEARQRISAQYVILKANR